ncbi:MAG: peptidoglycan-binding protein [Candidatus Peribacteria bacterium]|nr:peptidoglycan-binding protein [Candidatus Peribacteria bacterium]
MEKYVELSMDIKRLTVGLSIDEKGIKESISDFQKTFTAKFVMIEETYEDSYKALQTAYTNALEKNKDLVQNLAIKIQKVISIQEKYSELQQAEATLYASIAEKSQLSKMLQLSKYSVIATLQKELENQIKNAQSSNPEISKEKLIAEKDALLAELKRESDAQINVFFKSSTKTATYTKTLSEAEVFLSQYTTEKTYQCGVIISANREKSYDGLADRLKTLIQDLQKATEKLTGYDENQIRSLETASITTFKTFSTNAFSKKKALFRVYVAQLIAANQNTGTETPPTETPPTPSTPVSWTPYVFTKTYNKGMYALELKYLQEFLTAQGLYNGTINGLYDAKTIEAVYHYQLQEGVVSGKEANKAAYGWMGPATRNAVNKKMNP